MAIRVLPERVDVAHVVPGARPAVARFDSQPLDGVAAVDVLRDLRRRLELDRFRCTALIEFPEYQMHQVEAPAVPDEELRQAVRWTIKDMIDYPVDEASIDVLRIPSENEHRARNLFVVSARNQHVAALSSMFDDARIALEAVDIPELAQRNLSVLCEPERRAVALLAFHSGSCWLTITGNGELLVVRRIDISLDRLQGADTEQRSIYLDRIALELQRSFDNFDRQFAFITLSRLMLESIPEACGLKSALQANLDVPVEDFVPGSVLDVSRVPALADEGLSADRLLVLGAALRDSEARPERAAA